MKISDANPHIRYARIHHALPKATEYSICYDCRLFFFKTGSGRIIMQNEEYNFSNNTAVYLPPESKYKIVPDDGCDITVIIFNFDLVISFSHIEKSLSTASDTSFDPLRVPRYELPSELSHAVVQFMPDLYEPLKRASDEFLTARRLYRESASALIKLCLVELLRKADSTGTANMKLASDIMEYIHRNYHLCELSNEDIARHFGYHPYYLSRVFREACDKSIRRYLTEYRLRIAKNYLVTTDSDIAVIAWKSGFNSAAYFTKSFREYVGTTPVKYRRSHAEPLV